MTKKKTIKEIKKYCMDCHEIVNVIMRGDYGYCPNCEKKLYDKTGQRRGRK